MDSKRLAQLCCAYAANRKAENPVMLDMRELSSIADFFIILTGGSTPHLRAIGEEITDQIRQDHDMRPRHLDGKGSGDWLVIDFYDVIIHIMSEEMRQLYDLENLWGDAPRIKPRKPRGMGVRKNAVVSTQ
ncbi:MAG: ribosome silencing factor [Verrucomicrobiota bacterium]|jgi:ribosome-associated protein|nr:ribosome silencing factor [Verrucomicrobiota bacterium]